MPRVIIGGKTKETKTVDEVSLQKLLDQLDIPNENYDIEFREAGKKVPVEVDPVVASKLKIGPEDEVLLSPRIHGGANV